MEQEILQPRVLIAQQEKVDFTRRSRDKVEKVDKEGAVTLEEQVEWLEDQCPVRAGDEVTVSVAPLPAVDEHCESRNRE